MFDNKPLVIQFTGLSGSGKTTLANAVQEQLLLHHIKADILDGDEFRKTSAADLGYSKQDRLENIKRMGKAAAESNSQVMIISAINPYHEGRVWMQDNFAAPLIWISCSLNKLMERDTKGLYRRALLPEGDPQKLNNLTGLGDPFDTPENFDLKINTEVAAIDTCTQLIVSFILLQLKIKD
jgi:adenylylsulfate kinase